MDVPFGVSSCLFGGISSKIDYLRCAVTNGEFDEYEREILKRAKEAIEWYTKHCVVSSTHLHEKYKELEELLSNKDE